MQTELIQTHGSAQFSYKQTGNRGVMKDKCQCSIAIESQLRMNCYGLLENKKAVLLVADGNYLLSQFLN
jgi:hypothetical protein